MLHRLLSWQVVSTERRGLRQVAETHRRAPSPTGEPQRLTRTRLEPSSGSPLDGSWRKRVGVEPTKNRPTALTGFEVRPPHRERFPSVSLDQRLRTTLSEAKPENR